MAGKGMNDPHPGLEIVIHIQAGAVISTLSNPSARARKDVSALPWHQYVTVYFFTVLQ